MAVYTVHMKDETQAGLQRAIFVREGFSWAAFWFGPLWLFWRGLWLAFLAWIAAALGYAFVRPHLSGAAGAALILVVALFVGLEGNHWRRGKLARRGYILRGIIAGHSRDAAESAFFADLAAPPPWPAEPTMPLATPLPSHAPPVLHEPGVLGLFPDAEQTR